jgi:hypothetical protein
MAFKKGSAVLRRRLVSGCVGRTSEPSQYIAQEINDFTEGGVRSKRKLLLSLYCTG